MPVQYNQPIMFPENLHEAILATLAYHSIFNYPLTLIEIQRYLIGFAETNIETIQSALKTKGINEHSVGRYSLEAFPVSWDETSYQRAWERIEHAQLELRRFCKPIPAIEMIAISGSTAGLSSHANSDVDLMCITRRGALWTSRLELLGLLTLTNKRINVDQPDELNAGKYCLNVILENDDSGLEVPHHDLYTAMEIAHLKVIINDNQKYQSFIKHNAWIQTILPNFFQLFDNEWTSQTQSSSQKPLGVTVLMEPLARLAQASHFQQKFHRELDPRFTWYTDYRSQTITEWEKRFKSLVTRST